MLSNRDFEEGIRLMPLPCIDFLVINEYKEVLLGKRINKPAQNYYFAPGGRIRKNERQEEAIKRLSLAELGISLDKNQLGWLGVFDHIYEDNFYGTEGFGTHCIASAWVFNANKDWVNEKIVQEQHSNIRWVPLSQVRKDEQIHPYTKDYIRELYPREYFKE